MFDYKGRLKRYQESLATRGATCGVILRPPNMRYLTGFWGYATRPEYSEPRRLICLVVPANGQPLLVVPKIEYAFATQAVASSGIQVRRHVEWRTATESEDAWGLVREFLAENGHSVGRVEVESEYYVSQRAYAAMTEGLAQFDLVPGGYSIEQMRLIKDRDEIALLRQCGKVAVGMLEVEIASIAQGGLREYEVAMKGWHYVVSQCAQALGDNEINSPLGEGVQLITSGPRLAMAHGSASGRFIRPNDLVMMDFCRVPFLLGYRIGMGRVVAQRKLTPSEEDAEAAIQLAYKTALTLLRPGVTCSEIDGSTRDILLKAGLGEFIVHRTGRGVGIENVELPEIKEGIETPLQAGMVVGIEPSVYREGFASRVEETVLITEDEPEVLTPAPTGMHRITR